MTSKDEKDIRDLLMERLCDEEIDMHRVYGESVRLRNWVYDKLKNYFPKIKGVSFLTIMEEPPCLRNTFYDYIYSGVVEYRFSKKVGFIDELCMKVSKRIHNHIKTVEDYVNDVKTKVKEYLKNEKS